MSLVTSHEVIVEAVEVVEVVAAVEIVLFKCRCLAGLLLLLWLVMEGLR